MSVMMYEITYICVQMFTCTVNVYIYMLLQLCLLSTYIYVYPLEFLKNIYSFIELIGG